MVSRQAYNGGLLYHSHTATSHEYNSHEGLKWRGGFKLEVQTWADFDTILVFQVLHPYTILAKIRDCCPDDHVHRAVTVT